MSVLNTPVAVVIYTRFSTEMQRKESSEGQERNVRKALAIAGVDCSNLVVLDDQGYSGRLESRPNYERLRAMLDAGEIAVLGVDEQSRLTRGDNVMPLIVDLIFNGGRFISVLEGTDTNRAGWRETVKMAEVRHSMSSTDTAHRVRRGLVERVLTPNGSAGDFPYGYISDFEDKNWQNLISRGQKPRKIVVICEEQAQVVRSIFERFTEGYSVSQIVRDLNSRSVPTNARRTRWYMSRIIDILSNQKYVGKWTWGATETVRDSQGRIKLRPPQWNKPIETSRPQMRIVPQHLWDEAQKLRESSKLRARLHGNAQHPKFNHPSFNIGGLLKCGHCGRHLKSIRAAKKTHLLQCFQHVDEASDRSCPMNKQLRVKDIEKALYGLISEIYSGWPEWLKIVRENMATEISQLTSSGPGRIETTKANLHKAQLQLDNLLKQVLDSGITIATIKDKLVELQAGVDTLKNRLADQMRETAHVPEIPSKEWFQQHLADIPSLLSEASPSMAKLLKCLCTKAEVFIENLPEGGTRVILKVRFDVIELLAAGLLPDTAFRLREWLAQEHLELDRGSPEFIMEIIGPARYWKWGPRIHELRLQGLCYGEIAEKCGMRHDQVHNCYVVWRRVNKVKPASVYQWQRLGEMLYPMWQQGLNTRDIAVETGIKQKTVSRCLNRWRKSIGDDMRNLADRLGPELQAMRDNGMAWTEIVAKTKLTKISAQKALYKYRAQHLV